MTDFIGGNQASGVREKIYNISDTASILGVERSAGAEVAAIFEAEGNISIKDVASQIGCHQRTLERRLREEKLTAELIRMASRIIRATRRLRSTDSLIAIATEEGFSDQAHMTRAFRASCGMTPRMLRLLR
jgi:AraC-like DNA-binding protein